MVKMVNCSQGAGRVKWPSVGFVMVCMAYALAVSFLAWGMSTPDLDRVWTLHHELKIGAIEQLSGDDRQLLQKALTRHPMLASALLHGEEIGIISAHSDGWLATPTATILRTDKSAQHSALTLDVQTPPDLLPLSIEVRGQGWQRQIDVDHRQTLTISLPEQAATAEIVQLQVSGPHVEADPSVLGIRVRFGERS